MNDMTSTRGDLAQAYACVRRQIDHPDGNGTIEQRAARALTHAASAAMLEYFQQRYPTVAAIERAMDQRVRALHAFAYPGDLLDLAALAQLLVLTHAGADARRQAERGGAR